MEDLGTRDLVSELLSLFKHARDLGTIHDEEDAERIWDLIYKAFPVLQQASRDKHAPLWGKVKALLYDVRLPSLHTGFQLLIMAK
jgi:hypothetical protein